MQNKSSLSLGRIVKERVSCVIRILKSKNKEFIAGMKKVGETSTIAKGRPLVSNGLYYGH